MATISRFRALAAVGRVRSTGLVAWLLWLVVHVVGLTGFKNRVVALFNWAAAFLGRGRPQRVITAQQVFARLALEQQPGVMPTAHAPGEQSIRSPGVLGMGSPRSGRGHALPAAVQHHEISRLGEIS